MNSRGNTLVNVLIALAITSILVMVLTSIFQNAFREQSHLQQKGDSLLAQSLVIQGIVNNLANCTLSIANKPFSVTSPPLEISLPDLRLGPAGSPSPIVRTAASVLTGGLLVNSIKIKNIINDGAPENFRGVVEIQFINNIRQTKDMTFPILFKVSTTTNLIVGCRVDAPPSNIIVLNLGSTQNYPANSCRAGWFVTPRLTMQRLDCGSGTTWVGVSIPSIDGVLRYDLAVEFGSPKAGSSGHGWHYYIKGLSNRQYLDPAALNPAVPHSISLEFYIGERINYSSSASGFNSWTSATPATNHPCIKLVDTTMMIECLN